ncbi:MAG: SMI1/KNR4 family protein [Holosporales bacterium]|jgi:hypothetical protein|nr:SMI1/KNR4 family protein [Holosporales bacterium]
MKNLEASNISSDSGTIPKYIIKDIESTYFTKFPKDYIDFITKHNAAYLKADVFDYFDQEREKENSNGITFIAGQKISEFIEILLSQSTDNPNDPDVWKFYRYFDSRLIPFGENGGGDFICFDYRNHNGDNPPIVIWSHDVANNSKRISFIANNFEEFINMLHEPEDE